MNLKITEIENKKEKKIIGVQIPLYLYEELKQRADERFISISDLVRSYIFKYIREDSEQNSAKL